MDPCCVPYCFLVSLSGSLLLVRITQLFVGLGLDRDYEYLHIHGHRKDLAETSLQAACALLVSAALCGYFLLQSEPPRQVPDYLQGPEAETQANSAFDSASIRTPLLAKH